MDSTDLNIIVERIQDKDQEIQRQALETLHNEVRSTQGTITVKHQELSVLVKDLESVVKKISGYNQKHLYDLMSVMYTLDSDQDVLKCRILGNVTDLEDWGHQYVKKLTTCIVDVINNKLEQEDYENLVDPIVNFLFKHNSELEAIDFIIELSRVQELITDPKRTEWNRYFQMIVDATDEDNRERIIGYVSELGRFYDLEELILILNKYNPSKYLVHLIKYNRREEAISYVKNTEDPLYKKQLLYILARNSIFYQSDNELENKILTNSHLTDEFFGVAMSLELLPPKKLEHMFKGLNKDRIDAACIANGLVHFAYCRDPVYFPQENDYRIKEEHLEQLKLYKSIASFASAGLVNAFEPSKIYDYYSSSIFNAPEVGAVLALALSSYRSYDHKQTIITLLANFIYAPDKKTIIASLLGISVLYAGTASSEAYDLVFPLLSSQDNDIVFFSIYVLGTVFCGSNSSASNLAGLPVLSACLEVYSSHEKSSAFTNFAILGISLFLYQSKHLRTTTQFSDMDKYCKILSLGTMHCGSGNQIIVDEILTESFTGETDALLETLGLLSCCLVGVGDSLAGQLLERISTSALLLDSPHLRDTVPLCIAMIYASNPKSEIIDILEKSLNIGDSNVNSLLSLGILGAGTCSSRILRILDSNYGIVYKDSRASSALIYAQGLVNLGKGMFSLSPLCYDKQVILPKGIIGLMSTMAIFLDDNLFKDYPFLFYSIVQSIVPKYVVGYDGSAKVGKPVDVVGLAGKPNKISAGVVHTFPVVLAENEKAAVEDEVCTYYIEDVVVKRN
jgi:26S proteasome regulatory subunit N1